jgi:uncharacterized protein
MGLDFVIEKLGDKGATLAAGLMLGLSFGIFAQRSRFCLRSACIEFVRGRFGTPLAVWLYIFAGAVVGTQLLVAFDLLNASSARMLSTRGSLSGAIIGGGLFGIGMMLTRGCTARLLVLAGQGNLRSLLSGLVFAVTAQASLTGVLSPLREALAGLWVIDGEALNASASLHLGSFGALAIAVVWLGAAFYFGLRDRVPAWGWVGGLGVGLTIMGGWALTYWLSQTLFDPPPLKSMTFTGPSAKVLMLFLSSPGNILDFDAGLIPGVFLGAFLAALFSGELKLEGFQGGPATRRYLLGAVFMGFGGMLAGGCSVGSLSGAAIFATTAWVTLAAIWAGGAATDIIVDRARGEEGLAVAKASSTPR